jgi:hypothetical protein
MIATLGILKEKNARQTFCSRRARVLRWLGGVALVGFAALNVMAWYHARAMTRFVPAGRATPPADRLSFAQKAAVLVTGITMPRPANKKTPADFGLPFRAVRFAAEPGLEVEAWHVPAQGKPRCVVVLFHGYAVARDSELPETRAFHDLGCAALVVDFRGSGGSDGMETTIGFRETAEVAAAVAKARELDPGVPLVLCGRSMGAVAILRAIAAHEVQPDGILLEAVFDSLLHAVENRFRLMGAPSFPAAQLLVFWGGVRAGFSGFSHRPVDYARSVACPSLVLHGEKDPRATVEQARAVFQNLAAPTKMEVFPGVTHDPCVIADPQRWTEEAAQFLDRLTQP